MSFRCLPCLNLETLELKSKLLSLLPQAYWAVSLLLSFCRPNNILPYDSNRIKLRGPWQHGDYINASLISEKCFGRNQIISAQSPLPRTVPHFLQMMQENNVTVITTLTTEEEQGDARGNTYCVVCQVRNKPLLT